MKKQLLLTAALLGSALTLKAPKTKIEQPSAPAVESEKELNKKLSVTHKELSEALSKLRLNAFARVVKFVGAQENPSNESFAHFLQLKGGTGESFKFVGFSENTVKGDENKFHQKCATLLDTFITDLKEIGSAAEKGNAEEITEKAANLKGDAKGGAIFSPQQIQDNALRQLTGLSTANLLMACLDALKAEAQNRPATAPLRIELDGTERTYTVDSIAKMEAALTETVNTTYTAICLSPATVGNETNPAKAVLRNRLLTQLSSNPFSIFTVFFKMLWRKIAPGNTTPGEITTKFTSGNIGQISSGIAAVRSIGQGLSGELGTEQGDFKDWFFGSRKVQPAQPQSW